MAIPNSYAGRLTSKFKTSSIILEIKKATVLTPPHGYNDHILLVTENMSDVQSFVHPLLDGQTGRVYIDARPYTFIERDGTMRIRNETDYELNVMRAKMELIWNNASRTEITAALQFSNEVFVRWLSELISFKFKLSPAQQTDLIAICALYVVGQYKEDVLDEREINRHVQMIANTYHLDANRLYSIYDQVGIPGNLDEFISAIQDMKISPRLEVLNALTIAHAIGGSWFISVWSADIVSLALEYPPAFATLVFMAMKYRMFKKSAIGERVERMNRRGNWEDFSRGIQSLFDRYIGDGAPLRKHHGFEEYDNRLDAPSMVAPGLEADWGKIAMGGGIAAAVFFFIYKLYGWLSGSSSSGGGGGGLPDAIDKIEEKIESNIKRTEETAARIRTKSESVDALITESKSDVSPVKVDAIVNALPDVVVAEAKPIIDHAKTPLQAAVVTALASSIGTSTDELKHTRKILGTIFPLVDKHRLSDEQFIAALASWDNFAQTKGLPAITLTAHNNNDIDDGYIKELNAFLDKLVQMPGWDRVPSLAAACANGVYVASPEWAEFTKTGKLRDFITGADEQIGLHSELVYSMVTLVVHEAADYVHGKGKDAPEERIQMVDEVNDRLDKIFSTADVAATLTRHDQLKAVLAAARVVRTSEFDAPAAGKLLGECGGASLSGIVEHLTVAHNDVVAVQHALHKSVSSYKLADALVGIEEVIKYQQAGKLAGNLLTPARLAKIRSNVSNFARLCSIFSDSAKACALCASVYSSNTLLFNAQCAAEETVRKQLQKAVNKCKED